MNIWNVALLARVFVFFAYPLTISGDEVWVSGFEKLASGNHPLYGWWETGFFNTIFGWFGWLQFDPGMAIVDGFSGATPLSIVKEGVGMQSHRLILPLTFVGKYAWINW